MVCTICALPCHWVALGDVFRQAEIWVTDALLVEMEIQKNTFIKFGLNLFQKSVFERIFKLSSFKTHLRVPNCTSNL